ncbi:SCO family protein [Olivibacter sp. SDN3]|uniref:SCO family protein n=1 Tax=Olivibacter sp. SDN3 TaxID=2764720 RepID=UPI001651A031|nr:SCO family protein [Olivibacter sp. SDN3]QNL48572.1 SCO family protein [Olivibacter sp. SDN3]
MLSFLKNYIAALLVIHLFIGCNNTEDKLPVLGERETITKEIDGKTVIDTVYQTIPDFSFVNQDSIVINNKTFNNSIYVADFFFTSCPSICPIMSKNLLKVLKKYKGNEEVKILSHSIDTKYDTPWVLKKYANKLGVEGNQWQFVHGTEEAIYGMANRYMVYAKEDESAPGGFEHQGWFILIDKEKKIRGAYDGTDDEQVAQLLKDMDILLEEYR